MAEPASWRKDCQEKVCKKKKENLEIKRLLNDELGVTFPPVEFRNNELWNYDGLSNQTFEPKSVIRDFSVQKVRL